MLAMSKENIATVGDLIEHLQTLDKNAKLCFWEEGGAYMNCVHIHKSMLGDLMFKTVAKDKERRKKEFNDTDEQLAEDFEFVDDNDIIVY